MEDLEIQNIWKKYNSMIEESKVLNLQSWALNLSCFETLQTQKAAVKLKALILPKIAVIILGIGWLWFLGFIFYYTLSQIIIAVSLGFIMLFTIVAIITSIRDVVLISTINYSETIVEMQQQLAVLQSSIVNSVRFIWLQLPFYTTFYITNKLALTGGWQFWLIQIPATLLFIWLAVYLYKNISFHSNNKWLLGFLRGYGLNHVAKAMDFIKEIDEFKKELV